jgi:hypothetical protein
MALNTGGSPSYSRRCDSHPQGSKEEEGCGSSIWQCSSQAPDGVPPRPHLPAESVAPPPPASAAAVDSTFTTTSVAPACTTDRWNHLQPRLLELRGLGPLRSRVPHVQEEHRSGQRHPSTTWSIEGRCCKDRPCQLHCCGRHS